MEHPELEGPKRALYRHLSNPTLSKCSWNFGSLRAVPILWGTWAVPSPTLPPAPPGEEPFPEFQSKPSPNTAPAVPAVLSLLTEEIRAVPLLPLGKKPNTKGGEVPPSIPAQCFYWYIWAVFWVTTLSAAVESPCSDLPSFVTTCLLWDALTGWSCQYQTGSDPLCPKAFGSVCLQSHGMDNLGSSTSQSPPKNNCIPRSDSQF